MHARTSGGPSSAWRRACRHGCRHGRRHLATPSTGPRHEGGPTEYRPAHEGTEYRPAHEGGPGKKHEGGPGKKHEGGPAGLRANMRTCVHARTSAPTLVHMGARMGARTLARGASPGDGSIKWGTCRENEHSISFRFGSGGCRSGGRYRHRSGVGVPRLA